MEGEKNGKGKRNQKKKEKKRIFFSCLVWKEIKKENLR